MSLLRDLGPILRAITRRRGAFALIVFELASSFAIIGCLLIVGRWYQRAAAVHGSAYEEELIEVVARRPALSADADVAAAAAARWQGDLRRRLAEEPGVRAVARVSTSLLDDAYGYPSGYRVLGATTAAGAPPSPGWTVRADAALPEVLGLTLREGRLPSGLPAGEQEGTALITGCLREALFPNGAPAVDRSISSGEIRQARVVGVVDAVYMRPPLMAGAQCFAIHFTASGDEREARFLVRTEPGRRDGVAAALSTSLHDGTPGSLLTVTTFAPENQRHYVIVTGLLITMIAIGVNVALLALVGALAVASFLVAERTRQIGVRRALGATSGDIIQHFLIESTLASALGVAVGLLVTMAFMVLMREAFHSIRLDGWPLVLTALLLWIEATAAALLPALRASRIPPSFAAKSA